MAAEEFRSNKLRTFLSLFGVTIGIFCIISVLSVVGSLEAAIQKDIKSMGSNTVYIDKWEYGGGNDYPWWKFVNRPVPKSSEVAIIKGKVPAAKHVAFQTQFTDAVEYENSVLSNVTYSGISDEFLEIQPLEIVAGRNLEQRDFDHSANVTVLGNNVATELFGREEQAVGKNLTLRSGKIVNVIGVIKKEGKGIVNVWEFDDALLLPYTVLNQIRPERWSSPKIIVQAKDDLPMELLLDELTGAMRSLRKLKPSQADNFSLNDIGSLSKFISDMSGNVKIGGWAIAVLSLVVGMFGVANIMFVTVRERTSQIGLKKALGAKRGVILTEFLLESAFLCIMGGIVGLLLVFILTKIFSAVLGFALFISADIIVLAIGICVVVGVSAGIIPASIAARMDPVVAIRSK